LRGANDPRKLQSKAVGLARDAGAAYLENRMEHVEPLEHDAADERPLDPRRRRSRRYNLVWPLLMIGAVVVAGVLVWRGMHAPETVTAAPPAAPAAEPASPAPAANAPKYPIEAVAPPPAEVSAPLPDVGDSDAALKDAMAALFGANLDRIFHLQEIARRFVATIDNLPRQSVALSRMSVKPVGGGVVVTQSDGRIMLRADNATRYAGYIHVLDQTDTQKLVRTYVHFYPLFQKAYVDLGYPHGN
jgi:hypothetical protein